MIGVGIEGSSTALNVGGLGLLGVVAALVFRTLWRQDDGWRSVLDAARADSKAAREDAATAREDAAQARHAETECRARLSKLEADMDAMRLVVERRVANAPPPSGIDNRKDHP